MIPRQTPQPSGNSEGLTGRVILCVDDDAAGLYIRKQLLESVGYSVICSVGAKDGLALFSMFPVHLVILDYSMPELNGAQVAAAMRKLKPEVPIIMLSAHPQCPDDAGETVDDYFVKGESPRFLLAEIRKLVAKSARSSHKKECSSTRTSLAKPGGEAPKRPA